VWVGALIKPDRFFNRRVVTLVADRLKSGSGVYFGIGDYLHKAT